MPHVVNARQTWTIAILSLLTFAHASIAQEHVKFITIDVPDALGTIAVDINSHRDIVGRYCLVPSCVQDITGTWHGFRLSGGEFVTIDVPGAFHTNATGINARGDIVGRYRAAPDGGFHGFLLSDGEFTTIDVPGAFSTRASGITPDGDTIVGDYCTDPGCVRPASGNWHGFLLQNGAFTSFDVPGAVFTQAWRINRKGEILGRYKGADGAFHVFLLKDGRFTSIDFPGASNTGGDGGGVTPRGDIVSSYCDGPGCAPASTGHGFLLRSGEFVPFDVPEAVATVAEGVNPRGEIVGVYLDTGGNLHGFERVLSHR